MWVQAECGDGPLRRLALHAVATRGPRRVIDGHDLRVATEEVQPKDLGDLDRARKPDDELARLPTAGRAQLEVLREEDDDLHAPHARDGLPRAERKCGLGRLEPDLGEVPQLLVRKGRQRRRGEAVREGRLERERRARGVGRVEGDADDLFI